MHIYIYIYINRERERWCPGFGKARRALALRPAERRSKNAVHSTSIS